jgi:hypothetical protein
MAGAPQRRNPKKKRPGDGTVGWRTTGSAMATLGALQMGRQRLNVSSQIPLTALHSEERCVRGF